MGEIDENRFLNGAGKKIRVRLFLGFEREKEREREWFEVIRPLWGRGFYRETMAVEKACFDGGGVNPFPRGIRICVWKLRKSP